MGGKVQGAGVWRQGEDVAEASTGVVAARTKEWSGDQRASPNVATVAWLPEAAPEDDALPRVAEARPGDCQWSSGGSGATPGGRTIRLRRHALAAGQGRSTLAPAVYRIERRLAKVRHLVSTPNPSSPEQRRTPQNPQQSTIALNQGGVTTMLGIQLHSFRIDSPSSGCSSTTPSARRVSCAAATSVGTP